MKRRLSRAAAARNRSSSDVGDAREYLERLARILVRCGQSPKNLQREFAVVCRTLAEPTEHWESTRSEFVSDLPHVLTHWHDDAQYLDSQGRPVALPLKGRGPSVSSLVRRVMPEANVSRVVRSLIELRGIRRQGRRYVPTDWYVSYNRQPASAFAHGLTALLGMLRTIERNIASPHERFASKARCSPTFRRSRDDASEECRRLGSRRHPADVGGCAWSEVRRALAGRWAVGLTSGARRAVGWTVMRTWPYPQ